MLRELPRCAPARWEAAWLFDFWFIVLPQTQRAGRMGGDLEDMKGQKVGAGGQAGGPMSREAKS